MTPLQSYNDFLTKFKQFARPLGLVITDPDFRVSILTYAFTLMTVLYCLCSLYTIAAYDFTTAVQCVALCGVGFQGPVKIYTAIVYAKKMKSQVNHIGDMYKAIASSKSVKLLENIEWFGRIFRLVIVVFVTLVVATGISFGLFPALMFVLTQKRYSILTAFIPFVNESELTGYFITLVFHLWCLVLACIGEFLADGMFISCVLHLWPMNDVLDVCVNDLNQSLNRMEISLAWMQFRNILLIHQEFYL